MNFARTKSTKEALFASLDRSFGRPQRRAKGPSEFEEILDNYKDVVNEMGPLIGFLAFIYDSSLPIQYEQYSLQFDHLRRSYQSGRALTGRLDSENEGNIEAIFELDKHMVQMIVLLAEHNPAFLERTLQIFDKKQKGKQLYRLMADETPAEQQNGVPTVQDIVPVLGSKQSSRANLDYSKQGSQGVEAYVTFVIPKKILIRLVKQRAYKAIASVVSRPYFICGKDAGIESGEPLDLAVFL